jgi:hypothetical protein
MNSVSFNGGQLSHAVQFFFNNNEDDEMSYTVVNHPWSDGNFSFDLKTSLQDGVTKEELIEVASTMYDLD